MRAYWRVEICGELDTLLGKRKSEPVTPERAPVAHRIARALGYFKLYLATSFLLHHHGSRCHDTGIARNTKLDFDQIATF